MQSKFLKKVDIKTRNPHDKSPHPMKPCMIPAYRLHPIPPPQPESYATSEPIPHDLILIPIPPPLPASMTRSIPTPNHPNHVWAALADLVDRYHSNTMVLQVCNSPFCVNEINKYAYNIYLHEP